MKLKHILLSSFFFAAVTVVARRIFFDEFNASAVAAALIGALIFLLIFYSVVMKFLKTTGDRLQSTIPAVVLKDNEDVLLEAPANLLRGMEGVGGRLTLTNQRLVFQAHKFNVQTTVQEIPVEQVSEARSGDLNQKILRLKLRNEEVYKFVVESPPRWIDALPNR